MAYNDLIKDNYESRYNEVQASLSKFDNLFPSNDSTKYLDCGNTLLLQLVFQLKVGFLEEFTTIFSFAYAKHTFEKMVLALEKDNYLISQNTKQFGKAFILGDKALHFLSNGTIKKDSFPSEKKLLSYKIINGIFARNTLCTILNLLDNKFHELPKEFRTKYTKSQFLTHYVYPSQKASSTYTTKDLLGFLPNALKNMQDDEALLARYRHFVKCLKSTFALDTMESLQVKYAFYKDFANQVLVPRESSIKLIRTIFSFPTNALRSNPFVFWSELYKSSNEAKSIKIDFQRFYNDELLRNYTITKRNLGNTKSNDEKELHEILKKIEDLNNAIANSEGQKEKYDKYFEGMVFKNYNEQDIATFESKIINLDVLKKNACYITNLKKEKGQKPLLTFAIIDDSIDELATSLLFKRLEYLYSYYRKHLICFDYEIKLYTYRMEDVHILKEKLRLIKQQFKDIGEFGLFLPKLEELVIIASEVHPSERYQIMQNFQNKQKF